VISVKALANPSVKNWAQGFYLPSSPVHPGTQIGFALDEAMLGVKLDSAPTPHRHRLLPTPDDGRAANEYEQADLTASARVSESSCWSASLLPKLGHAESEHQPHSAQLEGGWHHHRNSTP